MRRSRILKAADLVVGDQTAAASHGAGVTEDGCDQQIQVTLRRGGDLVEAIVVSCPCGRTTEVECLYDPALTNEQTPGE